MLHNLEMPTQIYHMAALGLSEFWKTAPHYYFLWVGQVLKMKSQFSWLGFEPRTLGLQSWFEPWPLIISIISFWKGCLHKYIVRRNRLVLVSPRTLSKACPSERKGPIERPKALDTCTIENVSNRVKSGKAIISRPQLSASLWVRAHTTK